MTFTVAQTKQLLAPINPVRVLQDPRGNSHVSQQDVVAHLIRVFGFGSFSTELLQLECLAEKPRDPEKTGYKDKWDVVYRAVVRLSIFEDRKIDGANMRQVVCSFEDASTGDAQNQNYGDAHDLAMKSAISVAKKRCAIHLGDQFGLSLYNKGQMAALVKGTLVLPTGWTDDKPEDIQRDVPPQESMGIDETHHDSTNGEPEVTDEQKDMLAKSLGATEVAEEKS